MFINVNDVILDYEEYQRRVLIMKQLAWHALKEALELYGFTADNDCLYSEQLDLEVKQLWNNRTKHKEV